MDAYLSVLDQRLSSRRLRRLLQDWASWRQGREFPSRTDLFPEQITYILGNILLLDVLHGPLRFRYRLVGTNFVSRHGRDLTGKLVDEHPCADYRAAVTAVNRRIVEERRADCVVYNFISRASGEYIHYESLNLPLSEDGANINILIAAVSFPGEEYVECACSTAA